MDKKVSESPAPNTSLSVSPEAGGDVAIEGIDGTLEAISNLEVLSSTVSENKGASASKKGDNSSAGGDDSSATAGRKVLPLPSSKVMVRKIQTRLNNEIKQVMKDAKKSKSPYEMSIALSKVRTLKLTLAKLGEATMEYIEELYKSLFRKKVKRT